jgi:hypothetical protein
MMTNSFAKAQHALMNGLVFLFLKEREGFFKIFFSLVPNLMCSHHAPKMFPIAPRFYLIWFAQSSTPMYIN